MMPEPFGGNTQPHEADTQDALHGFIARQFHDLLRNPLYPCTVARGTAAQDRVVVSAYDDINDPGVAAQLLQDLYRFVAERAADDMGFYSFAAIFSAPASTTEAQFERLLWTLLQRLHELDRPNHPWDPSVSADPESEHFSFSLGGRAFFTETEEQMLWFDI